MVKLLIGGSPCTSWSVAQKQHRETEACGQGWELFKNYLVAKQKFKPDIFLYENNKSASQAIKDRIKVELGVDDNIVRYIEINSALVSAQNRKRFYVHNCGNVQPPEDRGILLKDVLDAGYPFGETNGKAYCLTATYYKGQPTQKVLEKAQRTMVAEPSDISGDQIYQVINGKINIKGKFYPIKLKDGFYVIRKLSVTECCRLQTMPDDYCRTVSNTQAYRGLGNGWTADVIKHILSNGLWDVPKDEELVVLSMYDGIGTGRYVLDSLGFTNVKYFAYEIDKYAIEISMSNYPDIIQMGDAFQLRCDDWKLGVNNG